MEFLTSGSKIRRAIRELLRDPIDERIVAVAYVGADACDFLGDPAGLTVYCWPQAGGTNPHGIDALIRKHAIVHFVDRLHAKVFWSRRNGAILGSPNLSQNALGERGLIETAVHLPPESFDFDAFFNSLRPMANFEDKLTWLHRAHLRFRQRNPERMRGSGARRPVLTFAEWERSSPRREWRMAVCEVEANAPRDAVAYRYETGSEKFAAFYNTASPRDLKTHVFTLETYVRRLKRERVQIRSLRWWVPEHVFPTNVTAWESYPYIWFARRLAPAGEPPPFDCKDKRFKTALADTIDKLGGPKWLDTAPYQVSNGFIRRISKQYHAA